MEVVTNPETFPCFNFTDDNGVETKVTAVVVPLVTDSEGGKTKISWGCSRGKSCHTKTCIYARHFQDKE